jgi:hypothetical protein
MEAGLNLRHPFGEWDGPLQPAKLPDLHLHIRIIPDHCMLTRLVGCEAGRHGNHPHRPQACSGSDQMRIGFALLISLWCGGCAWLGSEKPSAVAPQQAAALEKPAAPVADAAPPRFECSDGTISTSQSGCLVNMARARLPPGQQTPSSSASPAYQPPADAAR